ncbi:MAG TPA: DUF4476 domain-containing protein [Bacteroidia bacterium]|nr:DUF4476 domain-containing protein [Bacteroidia bacterium]
MKHLFLLATLLISGVRAMAQDKINLVVFSEDGYPFYAYVNGVRQNDKAESNVKVTGLSPNVSLRIEFEDKVKPQLKQNMALEAGFEHSVRIKEDSKKQLKLRYFGKTALNDPANASAPTVAYHSTEDTPANNTSATSVQAGESDTQVNTVSGNAVHSESSVNSAPGNVAINMNVNGMGISMNVNSSESTGSSAMQSSGSSLQTSSSSSTRMSSETSASGQTSGSVKSSAATGVNNCGTAMSSADFSKMKQSVESKPFADTKMSTARVATKNSCLSLNQVREICKLFSMDEDKLAYAKYAYDYCTDKTAYYQVADVFSFSSSADELNAFLESK